MTADPPASAAKDPGSDGDSLEITAASAHLAVIRDFVRRTGRHLACDPQTCEDLACAVDEACQNIIRYAYAADPGGPLRIEMQRRDDRIVVRLVDAAPPVDPAAVSPRPRDPETPGGLGTHLIHALVDEVTLEAAAGNRGNILWLSKRTA